MPRFQARLWKNTIEIETYQIDLIEKIKNQVADLIAHYDFLVQFDRKQITCAFDIGKTLTVVGLESDWHVIDLQSPKEILRAEIDASVHVVFHEAEIWISPTINNSYRMIKSQNDKDQFIGITFNPWTTKAKDIIDQPPEKAAFAWANSLHGTVYKKEPVVRSRFVRIIL